MKLAVKTDDVEDVRSRFAGFDWTLVSQELDTQGHFVLEGLLSAQECESLTGLYHQDELFRSRVIMKQHGFGSGEYKYFRYPLPELVRDLRSAAYPHLAETANRWSTTLGLDVQYPLVHEK